jgi:hypothetical protein
VLSNCHSKFERRVIIIFGSKEGILQELQQTAAASLLGCCADRCLFAADGCGSWLQDFTDTVNDTLRRATAAAIIARCI